MDRTASKSRRVEVDILKLMEKHEVTIPGNKNELIVQFHGPKETPYEGGTWMILLTIPDNYPFKSPSIGFMNRVYHPNIDLQSGSVCLDVINQKWSPLFNLSNIFDSFLPLLLSYPEPEDPLNANAAALLISDREKFDNVVRSHVAQYATARKFERNKADANDDSLSDLSE
ncbi:ubiquitin-conjugating enzyme E2 H-like [Nilaparvata lugens]|uniref:ubiquitin-conjugating enzyme E2 H-like n=1 Tax=Nilaparvata lugens TaxID=108931 RepID=UPI00193E532B|nr:ubiquitin-conjugating enzyme E2 H-like [Nilaparvata lugens]